MEEGEFGGEGGVGFAGLEGGDSVDFLGNESISENCLDFLCLDRQRIKTNPSINIYSGQVPPALHLPALHSRLSSHNVQKAGTRARNPVAGARGSATGQDKTGRRQTTLFRFTQRRVVGPISLLSPCLFLVVIKHHARAVLVFPGDKTI